MAKLKRPEKLKIEKPDKVDLSATLAQAKTQFTLSQLEALAGPEPDPLAEVEYVGNVEQDCQQEVSALLQGFKDRNERDTNRFNLAVDTEYWCCLVFQSRRQKDLFLKAMGWLKIGDKFLDGLAIAALQGIELPQVELVNKKARPSKRFLPMAMEIEED